MSLAVGLVSLGFLSKTKAALDHGDRPVAPAPLHLPLPRLPLHLSTVAPRLAYSVTNVDLSGNTSGEGARPPRMTIIHISAYRYICEGRGEDVWIRSNMR